MSLKLDNQQNNKARENKKEDKKALKKFWVILICSGLLGMLFGIASSILSDISSGFHDEGIQWVIKQAGIFGSFVLTTIFLFVIASLYRKARRLYVAWDGEDEDAYNKMEAKLSCALMVTSIGMISGYFFFSFGIYVTEFWKLSGVVIKIRMWEVLVILCGMIYALAGMSIAQQKIINFDKELNPEKKGSVYDINFNDKWMETSDEAERFITYKSAYQAFRMMQKVFPAAWVVSLLGMLSFDTGLFPAIVILVLWMVMVCTYCIHSIYYTKHSSEAGK